jgi:Fibronectin type III domain
MGDLAPRLRSRNLSEIVIPGSHDTTTYSVDHPIGFLPYAHTQDKDLTDQLNDGIRQLDIRVEYTADEDVCTTTNTVTVNTQDYLFKKRAAAPAFTAGTRAGTFPISVTSPEADNTLTLPVTITPDAPTSFVVTNGDGQATPINTKFPIALKGHWVDQYGNVVTDPPPADRVLTLSPSDGTWPDGSHSSAEATLDADGTITAPDLTAGNGVLAGPDASHSLIVKVGGASAWTLQVMPGPPAEVTAVGGDDQHTAAGKPFAQVLAAKVIDAGDNPIPGYPVTFKVTSGEAAFAPVNLRLAALVAGKPALLHRADPPRDTVTVLTSGQGVATAPVLTAGPEAGPIEVTASAGVAPAVKQAVFSLSADKVAPSAPTIDGVTDGDGQVGVAFSGASDGSAPITSYAVRATDENHPTAPPVTASGSSSPITVKGLANGEPYVFTVTATSADGTSPPSKPSGAINVGVAPAIVSGPANGTVDKPYSSAFTVTGAPAPTVTLVSGNVPGLTPGSDGSLTGTPTQAGNYELTVQATNPVGIYSASVTVAILPATLGAAPPVSGGRRVRATICTTEAGHKPACAVRTLTGSFPPLEAGAAATLVRGAVTYAVGTHERRLPRAHANAPTPAARRELHADPPPPAAGDLRSGHRPERAPGIANHDDKEGTR